MSNIQFEEEQSFVSARMKEPEQSLFVRLVIKAGLAKNERSAQYVLIGITIISFLAALLINFGPNLSAISNQQAPTANEPQIFQEARQAAFHKK